MLALIFFLAFPFLFLDARKKLRAARASATWPSVPGVITASAPGRRRLRQQPQVAYAYTVNGQPFAGTNIPYSGTVPASDTAAYLAHYPVGQAVSVFHLPTNPTEAVLVPGPDRLLEKQPMVLTGWLVALLLLNGIRFLMAANESAEAAKQPRIPTYDDIVASRASAEPTVAPTPAQVEPSRPLLQDPPTLPVVPERRRVELKEFADAFRVANPPIPQNKAATANDEAIRFARGDGRSPDHMMARMLFEVAAREGLPEACYNLGYLAEKGLGVPKDRRKAIAWYRKAPDYPDAQARLRRLGAAR